MKSGDYVHVTRGTMDILFTGALRQTEEVQQMVADLLLFWGVDSGGIEGVYKQWKQYVYLNEGPECQQ